MYPYQQPPSSYPPPPPGGSNPSYPPAYPPQDSYPPPPPGSMNSPYPPSPYQQSPGPGGFNPAYTHQPSPSSAPYGSPSQPPAPYGAPPQPPAPYGVPSQPPAPYGSPAPPNGPPGYPPSDSSPYSQPPPPPPSCTGAYYPPTSSPYSQPPPPQQRDAYSPYGQQQQPPSYGQPPPPQQQPYGGYGGQQQLNMIVNSASNMVDVEKFGKNDPYLQFTVNYQDPNSFQKTSTQKNAGKNCSWNQSFTLPMGAQELYIEVMDAERAGFDEVIGFAAIPLNQMGPQGLNAVFPIYTVNNKSAGEVHLTFGNGAMQPVTQGHAYVNEGHHKRVKGLRNKAVASDAAVGGAIALGVGLLAKHAYDEHKGHNREEEYRY
ncbi:hypothetical protein K492DRAFT_171629 [Lichtheimia hyalospora FSU 10163]|nr:hypothetical protein K492DRAFT_171629 [Lichtheimia hyalospora FSU 10163]